MEPDGQQQNQSSGLEGIYKTLTERGSSALSFSRASTTNPKDILGDKKPHLELIPPAGLLHASQAHLEGAIKYGPYNWRDKPVRLTVYIAAAQRHLLALLDGEDNAHDSGFRHEGHVIACMNIILDAFETGNLIDDRPIKGTASLI